MASARPPILHTSRSGGQGAASSSSSYHGPSRRHSLFGTEDRIVLDIGSKVSKFGFSGEARPRIIVDSVLISQPSTSSSSLLDTDTLWDLNIERCPNERVRKDREALLLARLTQLLRTAFIQHLMVDPKQRKVLVVENAYTPTIVKEMICKVLFNNLQAPSVSFIPSHLLGLIATGRITGLVVKCGYQETSIVPVYYARPMMHNARATLRAGRSLNRRLRALLLEHAKYVSPQGSWQAPSVPAKRRSGKVPEVILTDELLEDIKAKALFVGSYAEGLESVGHTSVERAGAAETQSKEGDSLEEQSASTGLPTSSSAEVSTTNPFAAEAKAAEAPSTVGPANLARLYRSLSLYDGAGDALRMEALKTHYSQHSSATSFAVSVPSRPNEGSRGGSSLHAAASSTSSLLNSNIGSGVVAIPGWVRERAAEILFETGDDDEASLVELAVDIILKLPIDLRRPMCENILVTGGTAMLPGMINRFRLQLTHALEKAERRRSAGKTKGVDSANVGASDVGNREGFLHHRVAVLNDPWPSGLRSKTSGGSAPAFPANMLPFIGASLAGVLKTSALSEITREAYDEALSAAEQLKNAGKGSETEAPPDAPSVTRPMFGAGNRGSFVGVVGGLETGAFGALAAVSRHLLVGGGVQTRGAVDAAAAGSGGSKPSGSKSNT